MEVYLVRHTTPAVTPGLIYGRMDVDLLDSFQAEVETVRNNLPAQLDAVYCSPSSRCTRLAAQLKPDYTPDERLYELNFGDWEGKTWETINQEESAAWMQDFVHVATPNGESMQQMNKRVMHFWQELRQTSNRTVAVVTHGGVIRLLLASEQGRPLASVFDVSVSYGEVLVCHPR